MGELIRVTQLPVIEEELRAMKASVEEAVANAKALACTPETIQTLKTVRAELRKRFDELERQRIAVKRAVMGPYDAFEMVYKECVSVLYQEADADLKKKIFATESSMKLACEDRMRAYYSELCAVHRVDFVPFEKTGVTVDMASAKAKTPTKLMKQLSDFVERVAADVDLIEKLEAAEEVMAEYKQSLNITGAISAVQLRHQRIQEEREEKARREEARRRAEGAEKKVMEEATAALPLPQEMPRAKENPGEDEEIFRCTFTVYGTRNQLRAIKEFMNTEGIQYE